MFTKEHDYLFTYLTMMVVLFISHCTIYDVDNFTILPKHVTEKSTFSYFCYLLCIRVGEQYSKVGGGQVMWVSCKLQSVIKSLTIP